MYLFNCVLISGFRFGWRGHSRDTIGTVLCVDDDGILRVGFPGASRGWKADPAEMERVEEFKVGDWVRIRPSLTTAKHGFGSVTPGSIGVVYCIRPDNGLLLELSYLPTPWHCEPEEVEPVEPFRVRAFILAQLNPLHFLLFCLSLQLVTFDDIITLHRLVIGFV